MNRLSILALVLLSYASLEAPAETASAGKQTEDLEKISEFNRAIWRYRRCVNRHEAAHGPSKDGKPPAICGEEPKLPNPG